MGDPIENAIARLLLNPGHVELYCNEYTGGGYHDQPQAFGIGSEIPNYKSRGKRIYDLPSTPADAFLRIPPVPVDFSRISIGECRF
jgi:hypothetical protein